MSKKLDKVVERRKTEWLSGKRVSRMDRRGERKEKEERERERRRKEDEGNSKQEERGGGN